MDMVGMIEIVTDSETIEKIQIKYGGSYMGALSSKTILEYIQENNKDNLELAIDNFIRSCAGYCVATYLLGIGDRHTANIMISETGHLFHIDFGHFLGNFKSKKIIGIKIKREKTDFVFTDEMCQVMGGKNDERFKQFQNLCVRAYNIIRKNGFIFINLFMIMLSSGMPELQIPKQIDYLRKRLDFGNSDKKAGENFKLEITKAQGDAMRKLDNMLHNIKHL